MSDDHLDGELLAAARHAQERLIEAEHDAEVARAEFHRALRRLHLHGGSLRELAQALGLSHQRVRKYRPQCTGLASAASPAGEGKTARHVAICSECLTLCAEIIAERMA